MSTPSKIIDLGQLVMQFKCGELQFYTRHLYQTATTTQLPFLVIPGASATYQCKDGSVSVPTYLIENNEAFREWHKQALQEMHSQLKYDPKLPATLESYRSITREQLIIIAAQATQKHQKSSRPNTGKRQDKKNSPIKPRSANNQQTQDKQGQEHQRNDADIRDEIDNGGPGENSTNSTIPSNPA